MQVIQIIDSMELNGGSTMFLEMVAGMRRYWTDDVIIPYVVSKTGYYGRESLISESLPRSYGIEDLKTYNYNTFQPIANEIRNSVIFHHVLGYTKRISFHKSCQYIVVNHITTNMKRLRHFKASRLVCVCKFFSDQLKRKTGTKSITILNGCEDYSNIPPLLKEKKKRIIGRCQRLVPCKFNVDNVNAISSKKCVHYAVGPVKDKYRKGNTIFVGPVFERDKKLSIMRSFDFYLHDTKSPEGASMAILEAISCGVPVLTRNVGGGTNEIITGGVNGLFFKDAKHLRKIVDMSQSKIDEIKKSARDDFLKRLHITRVLNQYRKLINL